MKATVFYAWQSDRPNKVNRNVIRDAAEEACRRITEDSSNPWDLTLDSDTQGVAGMCDIPNTILEKIDTCSMFLADATFVGRTDDAQGEQQMPNSNVLFELGFAAGRLGFAPLIGVVNEAFGSIEGQVFDIKRRASLTYSLPRDADPSTVAKAQDRLSRQLEEVFRTTLETVVAPRMASAKESREQEFKKRQSDFAARVVQGQFHGYAMLPTTLLTIRTSVDNELEYDDLYEKVVASGRNVRPSEESMNWSGDFQTAELGTDGVLLHAYGGVYESFKRACQSGIVPFARLHPEEPAPRLLNTNALQVNIVSDAREHLQLLNALEMPLPWLVGFSIVGAKGFNLSTDSETSPRAIDTDELHFGPCAIDSFDQVMDHTSTAGHLRGLLDRLCRRVGWDRSYCFTSSGVWNRRIIGS